MNNPDGSTPSVPLVALKLERHFDAAHRLLNYDGPCANLHGHRWVAIVEICGPVDPVSGMLMDFKAIKALLDEILPDHQFLNDLYDFNPTAENLVVYLFEMIAKRLPAEVQLNSVALKESPGAEAIYMGLHLPAGTRSAQRRAGLQLVFSKGK